MVRPLRRASYGVVVALLALGPACYRGTAGAEGSPVATARAFVAAVNAQDTAGLAALMTEKAAAGVASGNGFQIGGEPLEGVTFGAETITGSTATVPVTATRGGETETLRLKLRQENDAWRIYGLGVSAPGGTEMDFDLERIHEMLSSVATTMGDEFAKAWEQTQKEQAERALAERRETFVALGAKSEAEFARSWQVARDFRGESVRATLDTLAAESGLSVHAGSYGTPLARPVTVDVRGKSRFEAMASICAPLGLAPIPPAVAALAGAWAQDPSATDAAPNAVTFVAAAEAPPRTFAGPFVVSVPEVVEYPPHARGELTLSVAAYGVSAEILALAEALGETLVVERIADSSGQDLRAEPDVRYLGGGFRTGNAFERSIDIELSRLLRNVTEIGVIAGVQRLSLPANVEEATFDRLRAGEKTKCGGLTLTVDEAGASVRIDIDGPAVENVRVRSRALDAAGNDIQVQFETTNVWQPGRARYELQAESAPATLHLKLITKSTEVEYPFRFESIPLPRHGEMPERIEALRFDGRESPLAARFVRFIEGKDGSLPQVKLDLENFSNKDVLETVVRLTYLDKGRKAVGDFPHTISVPTADTPLPILVGTGRTEATETTAFFRPDGAASVRCDVEAVEFLDGTRWTRSR